MQQRIALAKALLREDVLALSQVALECGFSDQSHFTRSFSAMVGVSPGVWRRGVRA
jgi:AraC-like DNA-binding protein